MRALIYLNRFRNKFLLKYKPPLFRLSKKPRKLERTESEEGGAACRILMREIPTISDCDPDHETCDRNFKREGWIFLDPHITAETV